MEQTPDEKNTVLGAHSQAHINALKQNINSPRIKKAQKTRDEHEKIIRLTGKQYPPIDYDVTEVEAFLDTIFHAEELENEYPVCFFDEGRWHGYPITDGMIIDKLSRTRKPAKLYVGTSTVSLDGNGKLRNRKSTFKRFYVVVCDDIGTGEGAKIHPDKLPKEFVPTYIVETSNDNFQYGYVLETPIDDYEQAKTLIDLVAEAGFSDEGGKLVTKKVRMPQGIHGKDKSGDPMFRTRLVKRDGPRWTPDEILEMLGSSLTWSELCRDIETVRKRFIKRIGAHHWTPSVDYDHVYDGYVDPVLQWLSEDRRIISAGDEYVTIQCPWHDEHTDGNEAAYYSPLGAGEGDNKVKRHFKCFHDSCKTNWTQAFLQYVSEQPRGPQVPITDYAAELTRNYVYDAVNHRIWRIKDVFQPESRKIEAFNYSYNTYVNVNGVNDKKPPKLSSLFSTSPDRVVVQGTVIDPRNPTRILTDNKGLKRLNLFTPPEYGIGPIDEKHVKRFTDHIYYLIPNKAHADLFLDWLAAKAQNMSFRGWGVIMIAKKQGTGRGTLGAMLTALFHPQNCANVSMDKLVTPTDHNEWQGKSFVFTDEAGQENYGRSFYDMYNRLKDLVDTTNKQITINTKYGVKHDALCCTSHIMAINDSSNTRIPDDDRRFFIIENVPVPASNAYFADLHTWILDYDKWVPHVGRWLMQREVDMNVLNAPAPKTDMRKELIEESETGLNVAVKAALRGLPTPYFVSRQIEAAVASYSHRLGIQDVTYLPKLVQTAVKKESHGLSSSVGAIKIKDLGTCRGRIYQPDMNNETQEKLLLGRDVTIRDTMVFKDGVKRVTLQALRACIDNALRDAGY